MAGATTHQDSFFRLMGSADFGASERGVNLTKYYQCWGTLSIHRSAGAEYNERVGSASPLAALSIPLDSSSPNPWSTTVTSEAAFAG